MKRLYFEQLTKNKVDTLCKSAPECALYNARVEWLHLQMENKKPTKIDYETKIQDAISEAIADGDYD